MRIFVNNLNFIEGRFFFFFFVFKMFIFPLILLPFGLRYPDGRTTRPTLARPLRLPQLHMPLHAKFTVQSLTNFFYGPYKDTTAQTDKTVTH